MTTRLNLASKTTPQQFAIAYARRVWQHEGVAMCKKGKIIAHLSRRHGEILADVLLEHYQFGQRPITEMAAIADLAHIPAALSD